MRAGKTAVGLGGNLLVNILIIMKILLSMALDDDLSCTYCLLGWSHSIG